MTSITVRNARLYGELDETQITNFAALTSLQSLDLTNNWLYGELWEGFTTLSGVGGVLDTLKVAQNAWSGPVPVIEVTTCELMLPGPEGNDIVYFFILFYFFFYFLFFLKNHRNNVF